MDALSATPAKTQELCDTRRPTELLDESPIGFEGEGSGVHETSLNTMFSNGASGLNAALNNKTFTSATIARMHATMERLYEAARLLHQIEGPAQLAKFLNISEQLVNNWQRRGISKGGMLDAQKLIGCSATWLETGNPPMLAAGLAAQSKHEAEQGDSSKNDRKKAVIKSPVHSGANTLTSGDVSPAQRLRQALGHGEVKPPELASVAGVGVETAALWLGGLGPDISLAQAVAIQNTYGVNSVWLLKGKGEPGVAIRYADAYDPITDLKWRGAPVVGFAQLGDNGYWADIEYPVGYGDGFVACPTEDKDAYALRCIGDSMRPRIKDREFVVVEPNHLIEPGDEVLVKSKDGRVMVKEFLYERAGRVHLISVNEAHAPIALAKDEIEKMHYVGWIAKPSAWRPG
ncbi:S24 family peptidase [Paraburkholderia phenoliruptrix]|uniref:S24 family peptidase n=1 Tax=Paraburkholderia phenoliruptrix TaxID=252970 RepID=UPI001C4F8F77|nr:S24 family peptidase [Paraburkholderia phenoliruptrix]MBW0450871.1 LexA family transcriptional regulator [Paraburkholderia phenoliruptrix]MBW9100964.1 LexA family transcriptional regulator [Paraburkholderia phenoliruptrix]